MMRRLLILTVAVLVGSLLSLRAVSIPSAHADEIDEELRSTIGSDPEYRGRRAPPPAAEPAAEAPSGEASTGEEWQTMSSETHRPRRGSGGVGIGSRIDIDQEKNRIFTPKISFASNSDMPTPASMSVLRQLATTMVKHPELNVRIEGHTDSIGYDQPNLELSQRRAERVKDVLTQNGVDASRLQAVGMGDRYPVASSTTPAGQEKNRRVDFHLIEGSAHAAPPARPAPPPPPPAAVAPVPPPPPPAAAPAPAAPAPAPAWTPPAPPPPSQ